MVELHLTVISINVNGLNILRSKSRIQLCCMQKDTPRTKFLNDIYKSLGNIVNNQTGAVWARATGKD